MYSALLLLAALLAVPLVVGGFLAWRRQRSVILLFPLLALVGAVLGAGLAGMGRWLGPGEQLRDLHAFPALVGIFVVPMTLFTFATLARRAGFPWARVDWGHGAVCILAVVLLLAGLPGILGLKLYQPACWHDVVWYLPAMSTVLSCGADAGLHDGVADVAAAGLPALAMQLTRILVMLAWLGLGVGIWRRLRWPWLLAGMAPGALLSLLPWSAGPLPALVGPLVAYGTMVRATAVLLPRFPSQESTSP